MFIQLKNVRKSYTQGEREQTVLDDISLNVDKGAFVALTGSSGCGKTTLLNLIGGIDAPDNGHVIINENNLTEVSESQRTDFRRHYIGFVFQFFNLVPTLTLQENLLLPLELTGQADRKSIHLVNQHLDQLGIAHLGHRFPEQVSGGEQQRAAIARAMVHNPLLILADEPTGNLDNATAEKTMRVFREMVREKNTTLILVTHSREIASLADKNYQLSNGKIIP